VNIKAETRALILAALALAGAVACYAFSQNLGCTLLAITSLSLYGMADQIRRGL